MEMVQRCWAYSNYPVINIWKVRYIIATISVLRSHNVSGIPTTEKSSDIRFGTNEDYIEYKRRTPVLIPFFPGIVSGIAKVLLCCEFGIYNYKEENKVIMNEVK
jgi:hypothetical protein